MLSSRKSKPGEYALLQRKLFFRAAAMLLLAVAVVYFLYVSILRGRFAEAVISLLGRILNDENEARTLYTLILRNHIELLYSGATIVVLLLILRLYVSGFTKYFNEINRGIDSLVEESPEGATLSPELAETQRKIEEIRSTLYWRKEEARLTEQRKNDMIVYLAHDLKTPLSSVIGYLSLLRDEEPLSQLVREKALEVSLGKAERLEDLIDELLDIAKFNCAKVELDYRQINLTVLFGQTISEFQPMLREKGFRCELTAPPDLKIVCDPNRLQRVFDNLLRNAVSYGTPGSKIRVEAVGEGETARIRFTNEGKTIPPEMLDRIFEQFYRLDTSRSSASGGSGLGLAIAKEIVELHHGSITAESGDGLTVFTVRVPAESPAMGKSKQISGEAFGRL